MARARCDRNNGVMTQQELGLNLSTRRTRKAVFLDEMNLVVDATWIAAPSMCKRRYRVEFADSRSHCFMSWQAAHYRLAPTVF